MDQTKKTFVLSDESINSSGFWVSTAGMNIEQFLKNPIMLWSHMRAWRGQEDEILPIGYWENIQIHKDGKITGEPVFDENDAFAQKIKHKVENGVIRMCSVGIRVIETSADRQYYKQGQTREAITKSQLIECSLCDIGRNDNALAFYDQSDNALAFSEGILTIKQLELKDINHSKTLKMDTVIGLLKLGGACSEQEVFNAVKTLQDENTQLKAEKAEQEQKLKDEQKANATKLIDAALKDGRINENEKGETRASWDKFFEADYMAAEKALTAIPVPKSAKEQLGEFSEESKESAWTKRQAEIEKQSKSK